MRAATMATVEATIPEEIGDPFFSVHANGVTHDDSGGNQWTLRLIEGGRAVLYGCDHEASKTRHREQPLDLLAGAPRWLPLERLVSLQQGRELGFVYWYESQWHRVAYPADVQDDGLAFTVGGTVDMHKLVLSVADVVLGYKLGETIDDADEQVEMALEETVRQARDSALEEMVQHAREHALSAQSFAGCATAGNWTSPRHSNSPTAQALPPAVPSHSCPLRRGETRSYVAVRNSDRRMRRTRRQCWRSAGNLER
ncbi:hypothetical protein [Actinomadura vinacea]|uniref:hypothetical protein n=1 Tax=Actinomadura vinacea TaxID=115336 RepID=UPI0031DB9DF2